MKMKHLATLSLLTFLWSGWANAQPYYQGKTMVFGGPGRVESKDFSALSLCGCGSALLATPTVIAAVTAVTPIIAAPF